jgi:phosphate starvation-inducible PhoH-like protein
MGKKKTEAKVKIKKEIDYKLSLKCKTAAQKKFFEEMKDRKNEICFGIGSPGTGKSFLSLAYALRELKAGNFERIIMVVPTAQAGGADLNIGLLKGDLEQKVEVFKQVDLDTIEKILKLSGNEEYKKISKKLIDEEYIKYEFVNFLLGKTLDNSLILVNECEQYTKENMRLILTRLGENSKMIITGDSKQVNRKSITNGKDTCGLTYVAEKLKELDEVSVTEFTDEDIVRNKLIIKILKLID